MEVYTKTQVKKLLLEQRKNCSKSIAVKNGKKKFVRACMLAKEPDFSTIKVKIKSTDNNQNLIDWTRVAQKLKSRNLTPRESEVLIYISQGVSSKKLAKKLKLSEKTIEGHRHNIYTKLKVKNVIQAINKVHYFNK